jgi:hypothetical protein
MQFYEDMQLPGIDYLTKEIDIWRPVGSKFIITPKQCSSVANQLGKPEVLSEMYGVSDQGLTFADRKWIAEWLAALGINYRCYHAAFYSLRGARKRMYPPHIGYQQPYWPYNRMIADAMARLCYVLRQGRYVADVLVLHPLESAQCLFTPDREQPALQQMDQTLISLSDNLLAIHRGFDYGDEYLLEKYGKAEGNMLRVGEMAYRVVVLPGLITIRSSTLKLLEAFLDGGGVVLSVGELPSRVDGAPDSRIETLNKRILSLENKRPALREHLDRHCPPVLELTGPGTDEVWIHERSLSLSSPASGGRAEGLAGERIIFLVNTSRSHAAEGELRLRAEGRLTAWNLSDGRQTEIAQRADGAHVCTTLTFAPTESHLLVLREGERAPACRGADRRAGVQLLPREIPLNRVFQLTRHDPNALTLDFCRYRLEDGDPPARGIAGGTRLPQGRWSDLLPVIGILEKLTRQRYSGPVQLQYRFAAEARPTVCAIVLEDSEQCQVKINGTPVSRACPLGPSLGARPERSRRDGDAWFWDRGFHRIVVAEHVRAGENVVEVSRDYRPPDSDAIRDHERFYGTDLEPIYVIGDFAVRGQGLDSFRLAREESVTTGELAANGYPFYAGTVTLTQEIGLARPAAGERVFFDLGELHAAVALIRVNGRDCGAVLWPPYRAEITGAVKDGTNRIEIDLVNTLRNLLGPHHYTGPEKNQVWQTHFTGVMEDQDWMAPQRRGSLKTWNDAYEFVPFGVGENARIVYEKASG